MKRGRPRIVKLASGAGSLGVALVLLAGPARGEDADWPQFRGPHANPVGAHENLPKRWSKTQNVEWSTEIPGRGWSSPIVVAGRVFVTTAVTEGESKPPQIGTDYSNEYAAELAEQGLAEDEIMKRVQARDIELPGEVVLRYFLYCLDLETGEIAWRREIHTGRPPGGRHRKNSFASETPISDGHFVYVYVGNLGLYAYDLNGEKAWQTELENHPISLDFGTGSSPALHGDRLLILNDNEQQQFIAAFHKRTGELLWRTDREVVGEDGPSQHSGWTTPFVWSNELRTEIVTIGPAMAVSYDLAGKELWRLAGMSMAPSPSPFAHDGLLYLDAGKTHPLFALRPGALGVVTTGEEEGSNGRLAWQEERAGTYIPTPVAYEGWLYVLYDKGILARFELKTGTLAYKQRIGSGARAFTSSPWAYNGSVFCLSEEGDTYVLAAGESFELLHVNPLGEMAMATPAIVGERLLVRTESRLYSIRETNEAAD